MSGGAVEVSELQPPAHPGSRANFPGLGKPGVKVRRGSHSGLGVGGTGEEPEQGIDTETRRLVHTRAHTDPRTWDTRTHVHSGKDAPCGLPLQSLEQRQGPTGTPSGQGALLSRT